MIPVRYVMVSLVLFSIVIIVKPQLFTHISFFNYKDLLLWFHDICPFLLWPDMAAST